MNCSRKKHNYEAINDFILLTILFHGDNLILIKIRSSALHFLSTSLLDAADATVHRLFPGFGFHVCSVSFLQLGYCVENSRTWILENLLRTWILCCN